MTFKSRLYIIVFLLISFLYSPLWGQKKYHTKSKKAIKLYEAAFHNYNLKYFNQAKEELTKALKIDINFLDVYILLAEIASEEQEKTKAIEYYKKAINIKKDYNPLMHLRKGDLEKQTGNYSIAKNDYQTFLSYGKLLKDYESYVRERIKQCEFSIELKKHPVKFEPINLGEAINTPVSEYWPSLTADDSTLTFTSSNRKTRSQEDLYQSVKKNNNWQKAVKMESPINTQLSEGAQSISADGRTMVFTGCLRSDSYGSCDIYISWKKGNKWTTPVNMGPPINGKYKESQPSLSADGKTIYFASNRPGGKGKFDIWKSNLLENGKWKIPENLGDSINTKEEELAPFIHYDGQTLYFSSEGHPGMGGSDMFVSRKDGSGNWSKAKNLGYPINTHFNEESMIVSADGRLGMFSSNMEGGFGQKDIYQFEIPPGIQPQKTIFIKGIVYDAKTNKKLQSKIEISAIGDSLNYNTESDRFTGEFLTCLPPKKSYAFNIDKKGYLIYSENFLLPDSSIFIKIPLQPIEEGISVILKNIFFEYNSYELKKESFTELNKLINFLETNKVIIEIQGHTDNEGTESYNQKLSTNRAKSVYNYLISHGIKKEKLKYKGFGYSQPIASNNTAEGRAKNRRTAFKILSIPK